MEDNIYTLRSDIQQCIANNIKTLKNDYRLLMFENEEMEFARSLGCFENLKIFPNGSLIRFDGEIAKDLSFTEQEIANIKKQAWKKNMIDIAKQINESNKTEKQKQNERVIGEMQLLKLVDDIENEENYSYREPKAFEIIMMKGIQDALKEIGLELSYEEHEEMIILCGNFKFLEFKRQHLRFFCSILEGLDLFLIAPYYEEQEDENEIILNENEEECKSVRIVMGINLSKGEELCMMKNKKNVFILG